MSKHHYVYKSFEEEGREYIGIRSCDCLPEEDTKYFGTFKDPTFKPTGKTILFVCETREEVLELEIELHDFFDVDVNPQFANLAKQTSTKFNHVVTGELHQMYGKTGELNPLFGRKRPDISERMSGELNPMFGKKRPDTAERNRKQIIKGELNPMYGRTGELHPMFGRKNLVVSERNKKQTGELNPNYGKKWWVNPENECRFDKESPGPDWQKGRKFVYG